MSVQFTPTHGLKQKLTSALEMAVGSSVDPTGATTARSAGVHPKQPSIADEHCYGLPYQDHNYGAPRPPTPPELPMPSLAGPPEASVFNDVTSDSCDKFSDAPTVTIKCATSSRKNDFIESSAVSHDLRDKETVNGDSGDLTRCICGFVHDDGYMICCDGCSAWQHIDCMQIDRNSIPDTYLCEKCNPRYLDRDRAARLQKKKHEEFISCTDFDSMLSGSGEESPCDNVLYTAIHSTPTSITLSTNRKRHHQMQMAKKRKRSADTIKTHKNNDTAKRQRSKSFLCDDVDDEYGPVKSVWRLKLKQWSKSYQEAGGKNKYTENMRLAISGSLSQTTVSSINQPSDILTQLQAQLAKVQQLRSALLAMEDIPLGQPIIEYQGCFKLTKQFEVPMTKVYERPYPYILFYSGFDGLDICVDSRTYGNKARFIRRSCCPNSEVRHVFDEGLLRLFVYSLKSIKKDSEITLPFDIKYDNCAYKLPCACNTKDCPVEKSNRRKLSEPKNNHGHKRHAPFRLSLGSVPHSQTNGYASSEESNTCDTEDNTTDNQRKKSREERKMEAIIRAFEKLEKKERRKGLVQQQSNDKPAATSEESKPLILSPATNTTVTTVTIHSTPSQDPSLKMDNPSINAAVPSTSVQPSIPQKRVVRRRSGRVRRGSRKYHSEFYHTPTTVGRRDNDSQLEMFTPFSEDSCDSANQELAKFLPSEDQPEFTSFTTMPCASIPSVPPLSIVAGTCATDTTFSLGANRENPVLAPTSIRSSLSSVIPTTVVLETSKNSDMFQSAFSPTISTEECTFSVREFVSLYDQNETKTMSSSYTSPGLTLTTSTCRSRSLSGNSKSTESRSTSPVVKTPICTKPIYPVVSCKFVPWEFKPGLPRGMVPINTRRQPCYARYNSVKPVKKWWLQRAVDDCLALSADHSVDSKQTDEEDPPSGEGEKTESDNSSTTPLPWKKRLLSETLTDPQEENGTDENEESAPQEAIEQTSKIVEESSVDSEEKAPTVTPEIEVKSSTEGAEVETVTEKEEKEVVEVEDLPEVEEKNDVELPAPQPETAPQLELFEGETSVNASIAIIQQQLAEDPNYFYDETSYESAAGSYDTVTDSRMPQFTSTYPAPIKRKVSLQEYLKRSKETKKPSPTVATTSTNSVNPVSTVPTIPAESKHKLITSDSSDAVPAKPDGHIAKNPVAPQPQANNSPSADSSVTLLSSAFKRDKEVIELVSEFMKHNKDTEKSKDSHHEELKSLAKRLEEKVSSLLPNRKSSTKQQSSPSAKSSPAPKTLPQPKPSSNPPQKKLDVQSPSTPGNKTVPWKLGKSPSPRGGSTPRDKKIQKDQRVEPVPIDTLRTPPSVIGREDSWTSNDVRVRSRHGSGTSSSSSRSPRLPPEAYTSSRHRKQSALHAPVSRSGSDSSRLSERPQSPMLPQKVPCITPAVPGQPIPSLVRSGDGRGPQAVYNRPSPTRDYRQPSPPPPRWHNSPPYVARNGITDVGRVPDKYTEPPSPTYSNRYYEPDHRGSATRDYYRYDEHLPPSHYPPPKHQRHYNAAPARRYSNDGYPPRRTPSPQMFHYRHAAPAAPPYYNDTRGPYPDDQRYRYHKPPHPRNGYGRSPPDSPNPQHRRYPSPVPYPPGGQNYRSHYSGGGYHT